MSKFSQYSHMDRPPLCIKDCVIVSKITCLALWFWIRIIRKLDMGLLACVVLKDTLHMIFDKYDYLQTVVVELNQVAEIARMELSYLH